MDDHFLHLCVESETSLLETEASLQSFANLKECREVRLSVIEQFFFHGPRRSVRTAQLVALLETLLRVEPNIEKVTFDSGFTGDSNFLPLQVVTTAFSLGKALTRLDLSYVKVICQNMDFESWKLGDTHANASVSSLRHCCLDRASLLVDSPPVQGNAQVQAISLDRLILLFIHGCPQLEWLTVCSDEFEALTIQTLQDLGKAPNLQELSLWNFDLRGSTHGAAFFDALGRNHNSRLVRLTLPTTLSLCGAKSVARYLRQAPAHGGNAPLQGLTLTINQFTSDDQEGSILRDEETKQKILELIVNALRVTTSLQSFRMRGSAKIHAKSQHAFADMLRHNYSLQYFSILNEIETEDSSNANASTNVSASSNVASASANIQMYLKLNRYGRRRLILEESNNRESWLDAVMAIRNDLNCLFYLLQTNPSLCSAAGTDRVAYLDRGGTN